MGNSENLAPESRGNSGLRAALRFASFALPSIVTSAALLLCWRHRFVLRSILWAGFMILGSVYGAIFLSRRSRGLSARFFYVSTGPDQDEGSQDQTDFGVLAGATIYVGYMAFMLFKYW
jgi:hypothetical protein